MKFTYSLPTKRKVVDVPATSRLLKKLRLEHGYSVKDLQDKIGLQSYVAIYAWENIKKKNIPSIEHFDFLAKLYGLHVEELYVLKDEDIDVFEVHEHVCDYEINIAEILEDLNEQEKEEFLNLQKLYGQTN